MLLEKAAYHQLNPRIMFYQPRVCNILGGMMNAIGEILHVVKDIGHKLVVWGLPQVK